MPTSVRLDPVTEQKLDRLARRTGRSKSALLRAAIAVLDEQMAATGPTIRDQLEGYLAAGDLGPEITGRRAKQILTARFGRTKRP